jgi:hypothetical protein
MLDSSRRLSRLALALGALAPIAWLAPPPAHAQLAVEEIAIFAGSADEGSGPEWFFFIEVIGENLPGGSVAPPVGDALTLVDASGLGLELEFEDGPFVSFGALQTAHPAGDYVVTLDGGETVTLGWNPTEPVGVGPQPTLAIDQPADGAVGVSSTPTVAFSFDCTNCKDLRLEILDLATGGMAGSLSFGELDVVGGAFTNPIPFSSMGSGMGPPMPLPDGPADVELLLALVSFTDRNFDPPTSLPSSQYVEASAIFARSTATVPEPAADLAAITALGVLALIGSRRRIHSAR